MFFRAPGDQTEKTTFPQHSIRLLTKIIQWLKGWEASSLECLPRIDLVWNHVNTRWQCITCRI